MQGKEISMSEQTQEEKSALGTIRINVERILSQTDTKPTARKAISVLNDFLPTGYNDLRLVSLEITEKRRVASLTVCETHKDLPHSLNIDIKV